MKALPWILTAILAALVAWGYLHPRTIEVPVPVVTTVGVRDSARVSAESAKVVVVEKVKWLRSAPVDTMAAILRDRARRPVLLGQDTVLRPEPPDSASDSACLPQDVLAATAARQLADSANLVAKEWEIKIEQARGDSLAARLGVCLASQSSATSAYGRGFLHGAAAGAGICIIAKAIF